MAGNVTSTDGPECRIGRHPDNALTLDDDGISRVHARIYQTGGSYFIEDLGSSNGTYVDGRRITQEELGDGATVQLGPRVCFRFSIVDEQQERVLRQLYESSVRDALTGAYNRQYFMDRLRTELAYAIRHNSTASVLLLDVDHFKNINDSYGHPAGDAVLQRLSHLCTRTLRTEDVFARYGGEEFICLLRGVPLAGAARAAERLRESLSHAPLVYASHLIAVTASVGCASLACCPDMTDQALVATADRRLYRAKAIGRNRVVAEG
jgi:diguanylate cyclase (GGDEF)-like protein